MLIFLLSCVVCFGADQTIITVAGLIAAGAEAGFPITPGTVITVGGGPRSRYNNNGYRSRKAG